MNQAFDFERAGKLIDRLNELRDEVLAMRLEDPTETAEYKEMLVVVKMLGKALGKLAGESTVS